MSALPRSCPPPPDGAAQSAESAVLARRLELAAGGIPIGITNRIGSGKDKHAHYGAMPGGPTAAYPHRPAGPGPNGRGAQYYTTTDAEKIKEWSRRYPGCNTFIGGFLPDDVACIDIDRSDEFRALCPGLFERLRERGHPTDKRIGKDRWHIWVRMPEGHVAKELGGKHPWGEVKWSGGLVVSSPSATYESVIPLVSWDAVPRLTAEDVFAIAGTGGAPLAAGARTSSDGRHPRYLEISASMAARGCARQEIIDEIWKVDRESVNPAQSDSSRGGGFPAEVERMADGAIEKYGLNKTGSRVNDVADVKDLAAKFIACFRDIDIMNAPPVERAMLAPFCATGDFLNISGPAGCGKTSIAVDILLGAAHKDRSGVALGGAMQFVEAPFGTLKCAILDAETSQGRWESMLARKCTQEQLCLDGLASIRYMRASDFGLGQPSTRAEHSLALAEALGRDQRQLVVIDTLAMTWAPRDMNSPDWVFDGLAQFRAECKNRGVTVIALTHTRRPTKDGPSPVGPIGTSYQENQADSQIIVSRLKQASEGIRMTATKSRRAFWIQQATYIDLRFTATLGYEPVGNFLERWPHEWPGADAAMQPGVRGTRSLIELKFRENREVALTAKDIAAALNVSPRAVRDHCKALADRGVISRIGNGPSSAWKWVQR